MKKILVLTYQTWDDFDQRRGCVTDFDYDTIKEAKHHAKRALTDEYARSNEMAAPLEYAQVTVNGECVYDYFRKPAKRTAPDKQPGYMPDPCSLGSRDGTPYVL